MKPIYAACGFDVFHEDADTLQDKTHHKDVTSCWDDGWIQTDTHAQGKLLHMLISKVVKCILGRTVYELRDNIHKGNAAEVLAWITADPQGNQSWKLIQKCKERVAN